MDTETLNASDVQIGVTSFPLNLTNIKVESQYGCDEEMTLDVSETVVYLGAIKKEPDRAIKNEADVLIKYEACTKNNVKEEYEEIIIDSTTITPENIKSNHKEIDITFKNDLECYLPTNIQYSYCKECEEAYEGFCPRCPNLSYILHNISMMIDDNLSTLPIDILAQKDTAFGVGVFVLRTIPKGIMFGPLQNFTSMPNTNSALWMIKNGRLMNISNGNWMQCVNSTKNILLQNLDIFQYQNCLYFRSMREIKKDEELLVYFSEGHINNSNNVEEMWYCPRIEEEIENVYACTFCCLGFKLNVHLIDHKIQCPHSRRDVTVEEIIQCSFCNIFLEKVEYFQHHMIYCYENQTRKGMLPVETEPRNATLTPLRDEIKEDFSIPDERNSGIVGFDKKYKSAFEIDKSSLQNKLDTHEDVKEETCRNTKPCLDAQQQIKLHVRSEEDRSGGEQECGFSTPQTHNQSNLKPCLLMQPAPASDTAFKYTECKYRTHKGRNLKTHLLTHTQKKLKCTKCDYQTNSKGHLKQHLLIHTDPMSEKEFKCNKCTYQTHIKDYLNRHLITHSDPTSDKKFKCTECEYRTHFKSDLYKHLITHADPLSEKKFKCSECDYQTNQSRHLKSHLLIHSRSNPTSDEIYKCNNCEYQTHKKKNLRAHVLRHLDLKPEKTLKCTKCEYQTHSSRYLKTHLLTHADPTSDKKFKCDKCAYQTHIKSYLTKHLFSHTDPTANKKFKCTECKYQTHFSYHLKSHLLTHADPNLKKAFRCTECKFQTQYNSRLKKHLFKHSDHISRKEFKCTKCEYVSHFESGLKRHLLNHADAVPDKRIKCTKCNYQTNDNSNMKRHFRRHAGPVAI